MSPRPSVLDPVLGPLTDDLLTPEVRVFQRAHGHRFSSDDVATAHVAWQTRPDAPRALDLGCGLGSVLLLLAWKMRATRFVGVEAQDGSFELLRRNVARNAAVAEIGARVSIVHGDLREVAARPEHRGAFALVTGTPPYFPPGSAVDSADAQRAFARSEHRGGIEAYLEAAAHAVAADGRVVVCGDARADGRARAAAAQLGLHVIARREVIPRFGRAALFSVWTLAREPAPEQRTTATLRDAAGAQTADASAMRVFSGFAPYAASDEGAAT